VPRFEHGTGKTSPGGLSKPEPVHAGCEPGGVLVTCAPQVAQPLILDLADAPATGRSRILWVRSNRARPAEREENSTVKHLGIL
jgi:hypothetical protein